mgnify:CR=1 FL=1
MIHAFDGVDIGKLGGKPNFPLGVLDPVETEWNNRQTVGLSSEYNITLTIHSVPKRACLRKIGNKLFQCYPNMIMFLSESSSIGSRRSRPIGYSALSSS